MLDFDGKVAVVTGSASGMGRAMAERFAQEGMKVVLADVEKPALDLAVQELRRKEYDVMGVVTDVSQGESIENLAQETLRAYGKIHVLVNNAGVSGGNGGTGAIIWEASLNDWLWLTNVNYWGVAHAIRIIVPIMLAQDEEGHVVNTASIGGLFPGAGVYGATKHAVVSMSESLYRDFIRVGAKLSASVLCPGGVATQIQFATRNRPAELRNAGERELTEEEREMINENVRARRMPPPQVAEAVLQAIKDRRLYILTHDTGDTRLRDRYESILNRRNPTMNEPYLSAATRPPTPEELAERARARAAQGT